jgi:hypothetical protein
MVGCLFVAAFRTYFDHIDVTPWGAVTDIPTLPVRLVVERIFNVL